jgi:lysophospholipase L1-like esterase
MQEKTRKTAFALVLVIIIALSSTATMTYAMSFMPKIIRIACVGDSITEGSGYTKDLQLLLGHGYSVHNFGVSGSTASVDSKIPYINQTKFQEALEFEPNIVVIMLGTNDANSEITFNIEGFEQDYAHLVNAFTQLECNPEIVVVKSPPIFADNTAWNNTELTNTVIPSIEHFADQMNLETIDVYSACEGHAEYFADGIHPNIEGATVIASTIYDGLTSI